MNVRNFDKNEDFMYIIFDTETNGLPRNYRASMTDLDNWPRVIQFAWVTLDADMQRYQQNKFFIKPDGWTVPKEKFWVDKGYSTERCESEGVEMPIVLKALISDIERSQYMIAHNVDFDYNVLGAEMIRYGLKATNKTKKICTMKLGTDICCLPGQYGYKWPKLEELHKHLFGDDFIGAHDAMSDVMATMKCFKEMVTRKLVVL